MKKRYKFYDKTEQITEIRKYLEKSIENQLEEFIDENLERTPQKQFWTVDDLIEARKERQNWLIPSLESR